MNCELSKNRNFSFSENVQLEIRQSDISSRISKRLRMDLLSMNHAKVSKSSAICVEEPDKDGHGGQLHSMDGLPHDENVADAAFPDPVEESMSVSQHPMEVTSKVFCKESSTKMECRAKFESMRDKTQTP